MTIKQVDGRFRNGFFGGDEGFNETTSTGRGGEAGETAGGLTGDGGGTALVLGVSDCPQFRQNFAPGVTGW